MWILIKMEIISLILIYVVLLIIPTMVIAKAKNKDLGNALGAVLLFGVFALIYYIFIPAGKEITESVIEKRVYCSKCGIKSKTGTKFCPDCGTRYNLRRN